MHLRWTYVWLLLWVSSACWLHAGPARIVKVLPHYLDHEGRHSLSPSLYERDAYQDFLRKNPEERSALRFDINWKAKRKGAERLILRIELRSSERDLSNPIVLERSVRPPRFFTTWSSLVLGEEDYRKFGKLLAWRATLWRGEELLAEKRSFLW